MNNKNMKLGLFLLMGVMISFLLLGIASANTFVIGKIYDTNFNTPVSGASVDVTCQGNTKTTTSLADGAYGIGFELSECANESSVSITATRDNLYGSNGGQIDNSNETDYFTVKNIVMTVQSSPPPTGGGGGGGGTFYLCGNGVCDSGETPSLCPKDCKVPENITQETSEKNESEGTGMSISPGTEEEEKSFLSKITGAVIGGGSGKILIPIIFLILVGIVYVIIYMRRKK